MTPLIDQAEEAKDCGFLEEATAHPGGKVPAGRAVPRPQRRAARKARAQRCARPDHRPAAQEAPGRRVPRPPGRIVGPATGALVGRRRLLRPGSSLPRANFYEKAHFVKADVAAAMWRERQLLSALRAML